MGPTRRLRDEEANARRLHQTDVDMTEKDETERRLEQILFGDEAGFLNALRTSVETGDRALQLHQTTDGDSGTEDENYNLENVPDEDLFFLDAGEGNVYPSTAAEQDDGEQPEQTQRPLVWFDSDDERITISLASNTRLRKLRDNETDDVITGTEYVHRLRRQYERLHPTPAWAKYARKKRKLSGHETSDSASDTDQESDEADVSQVQPLSELLRSTGSLIRRQKIPEHGPVARRLRPETVDIQRLKDVAGHGPGSIDTLQFHPNMPLLLAAGPSSTIQLYHISPQPPYPNPLMTSLHVRGTPLHTAAFCKSSTTLGQNEREEDQTRIFFSSRRRYFHMWSLSTGVVSKVSRPLYGDIRHEQRTMESFKLSPCGRFMGLIGSGRKGGGSINVISTDTSQWICSCRIDSRGGIADFSWWDTGNGFAVIGKSGEVSEYEIESRRVIARWHDEGAVGTTVIALGGYTGGMGLGGSRWVAVGSSSGVVNVYDRQSWSYNTSDQGSTVPERPKPSRAFEQLTTPVSFLEFAEDGQMLVMGSRWKKNALRLVHLPSCTVYQNWPTDKTPLGRISSVVLSRDGTYLAVANEQGKIRLWQIRE